jgi:hypothetical protein
MFGKIIKVFVPWFDESCLIVTFFPPDKVSLPCRYQERKRPPSITMDTGGDIIIIFQLSGFVETNAVTTDKFTFRQ